MQVKLKTYELSEGYQGLAEIENKTETRKVKGKDEKEMQDAAVKACWPTYFQYFIDRNKALLLQEISKAHAEAVTMGEPYDKERIALNEEFAELDAGKPVMKNGVYVIDASRKEEYQAKQKELREGKYGPLFEEIDRIYEEGEKEVTVHGIDYARIENLELPSGTFEKIKFMINNLPKE